MDVITIEKTGESFRLLYDVKGRFTMKALKGEESKYKLCKVKAKTIGPNKVPYITTHDSRTIRYPHPDIKIGDTLKYDCVNKKIVDFSHLDAGQPCYITSGNNIGRIA